PRNPSAQLETVEQLFLKYLVALHMLIYEISVYLPKRCATGTMAISNCSLSPTSENPRGIFSGSILFAKLVA
ncbi:hypothetical protein, partial [Algibacter sp. 2305UL17-15]|uniref:hypothetical protein n=1 Tax=Algibacter sp. 2305UL17-15 TaxID=3231268 RepID=UPI003458EA91